MLKKAAELSFFEVKYLIIAIVFLPIMAVFIHKWGFKKTKSKVEQRYSKKLVAPEKDTINLVEARQIGRMVCVASRWGFNRANCLKRALLIWTLLMRVGIQSTLVFGAKKETSNQLNAHAWVEVEGEPIGESSQVREHYSVFEN